MAYIAGLKELELRLEKLGQKMGGKILRQAAVAAMLPVKREMKSIVPIGKVPHKSYLGRTLAPGYLSRSIKHGSKFNKKLGTASAWIGVTAEAFYGTQFVDPGTVHQPAQKWFKFTFLKNEKRIQRDFARELRKRVGKI
jgi:HK97 gp10 family phage protein